MLKGNVENDSHSGTHFISGRVEAIRFWCVQWKWHSNPGNCNSFQHIIRIPFDIDKNFIQQWLDFRHSHSALCIWHICICIYAGADISRIPLTLASSEISLFVIRFWDPFGCPYVAFGSDIFRIPSTLASSEIFFFVIHFRDPFGCPDNWPLDSNSLPAKNHSFVQ